VNKIISSVLSFFCILICILILISSVLTSEKSLKFILNLNQDFDVDVILKNSYWHPYRPSVEIDFLSVTEQGKETHILTADILKVNFNLLSIPKGSIVQNVFSKNVSFFINLSGNKDPTNFGYLQTFPHLLKNLNIESFSIIDSSNKFNSLSGRLSLVNLVSGSSKLSFYAEDGEEGNIDLRVNSILGSSNLKDFKGFIKTSKFKLKKGILKEMCIDCLTGELNNKISFTVIDSKLVKLSGNLDFKPHSSLGFVDSFHASIGLEDSKNNVFRISSYLNRDKAHSLPEIFSSYTSEDMMFYIPEISLGQNKTVDNILSFLLPSDFIVKGNIRNLAFKFQNNTELKADLSQLSLTYKDISITGIQGSLQYIPKNTILRINSPALEVDYKTLFDSSLIFNNLSTTLSIKLKDNKLSIPSSGFEAIFKDSLIKGHLSFLPSPHQDNGDLSISAATNHLSYSSAFSLFPNFTNVTETKNWLKKSISCGSLKRLSFIFRTPINNKFNNSSPSFLSKGSFEEACLNINGTEISNIQLDFKLNNSSFYGKIKEGKLFGSSLAGTVKTFRYNNKNIIEVKGDSEGPLMSLLKLSKLDDIFSAEDKSSGKHDTSFDFTSTLSSSIKLLGSQSSLKFNTNIKDGNLTNKDTNLSLTDLYSSIEYNNLDGVKDSFASLRINEVPVQFDIKKKQVDEKIFTSLTAENTFSAKSISTFLGLKKGISGSSKFSIEISLPSFIRNKKTLEPEIKIFSDLQGLSIDLPEPLNKYKGSTINFNLLFQPFVLNRSARLTFYYGDLFRGKLDFKENTREGFVIAGKKKQNISTKDNKIQLVGEIEKLNLREFISSGLFSAEGTSNFFIKDLLIHEANLSNLTLIKTNISSSRVKDGVEYVFINEDLSGKLLIPDEVDRRMSLKLDYLTVNLVSDGAKDSFLSLFNTIEEGFNFSTQAIFFNGIDYGQWEFSIQPNPNALIIDDIKGAYGKWGVKRDRDGQSSLTIIKNPFGWTSSLEANIYSGSPEKAFKQIGIEPNFEMDVFNADINLKWNNLPWLFDYNSIYGDISLNLYGLNIKNSEDLDRSNNVLRLVNIFNITDSIEKVTNLDFRKLYKRGFSADRVTGTFNINKDSIEIKDPILLKSGSSKFSWTGDLSRNKKGEIDELDLEVIMTLPLREYLPAYALILGGPITAGVVYIAGKAFEKNLDQLSSGKWEINGNIAEPKTEFKGWFEDRK